MIYSTQEHITLVSNNNWKLKDRVHLLILRREQSIYDWLKVTICHKLPEFSQVSLSAW